jgi:prepilin signal peptidase PulO-like enzyme (type II secretory pathway)
VAIPQGHKASPWPFLSMIGMAGCFFLYAVSGLVAPWYGVVLLLAIWVVLFVVATRWWTPHPKRTLLLPLVAIVVWFGVITLGEVLFDWTA